MTGRRFQVFARLATFMSAALIVALANAQGIKLNSTVGLSATPNPSELGQAVTFTATVSTQSGPLTGTTYASQLIPLGLQAYVASQQPWNLQGVGIIQNYDPTKAATVRLYAASFGIGYTSPLVLAPNPNATPYVDFDLASGEILATTPCCTSPPPTTATFKPNGTSVTSITASGYGVPLIPSDCSYPTNCPVQPGQLYLTVSIVPPLTGSFSGVGLWVQFPAPANPLAIDPSLGTLTLSDGSTPLTTLGFTDNGTGQVSFTASNLSVGSHTIIAAYSGNSNYNASTSSLTQTVSSPPPTATITSLVNAASYGTPAAGGAATIFGTFPGLTADSASVTPLPTIVDSVTAFIDNIRVPLYYVSSTQINVQIPWQVGTDENAVISISNGIWSAGMNADILSSSPGIFEIDASHDGAILHSDFTLVSSTNPAVPGETVLIYATGLGPVTPAQANGAPASTSELATAANPQVKIGSQVTTVMWTGLAPGFVGLYQINAVVPTGANTGNNTITLQTPSATSNAAVIAVQ
jgi:uncharacterized protein (TIGR03437 family)